MTNGNSAQASGAGNYAEVNGLNVYYEIHGEGEPLILLHRGFGATGMLAGLLSLLATHRKIIAVDLQDHGRTSDLAPEAPGRARLKKWLKVCKKRPGGV